MSPFGFDSMDTKIRSLCLNDHEVPELTRAPWCRGRSRGRKTLGKGVGAFRSPELTARSWARQGPGKQRVWACRAGGLGPSQWGSQLVACFPWQRERCKVGAGAGAGGGTLSGQASVPG